MRFGGKEKNSDLQVLCRKHHFAKHNEPARKATKPKKSDRRDIYSNIIEVFENIYKPHTKSYVDIAIELKEYYDVGKKLTNKHGKPMKTRCKKYVLRIEKMYLKRKEIDDEKNDAPCWHYVT